MDSLYCVGTSGSGSRSGANAGDQGDGASDERVDAGDERTDVDQGTSHRQIQSVGETNLRQEGRD